MNLQELQNLVENLKSTLTNFSRGVISRLERLELLFSPVSRNPGHVHTYPMGDVNYFNITGTSITISAQSDGSTNMVVMNPAATLDSDSMEFDSPSNGRLRYIGRTRRFFHVACTISLSPATANEQFVIGCAKNGAIVNGHKVLQFLRNTTDVQFAAFHLYVPLEHDDYLEIYIGNMTSTSDVTVKELNIFAMGMDD